MRYNINRKYNLPTKGKVGYILFIMVFFSCTVIFWHFFCITLKELTNDILHADYSFRRNTCCRLTLRISFTSRLDYKRNALTENKHAREVAPALELNACDKFNPALQKWIYLKYTHRIEKRIHFECRCYFYCV